MQKYVTCAYDLWGIRTASRWYTYLIYDTISNLMLLIYDTTSNLMLLLLWVEFKLNGIGISICYDLIVSFHKKCPFHFKKKRENNRNNHIYMQIYGHLNLCHCWCFFIKSLKEKRCSNKTNWCMYKFCVPHSTL